MENLLVLALLAAGIAFWLDTLAARERAIVAAGRACQELGLQLLDQTVALESLRPARNERGHLSWRRIYGFEYSLEGVERRRGRAILLGRVLEQVQVDNPHHGTTIEQYH